MKRYNNNKNKPAPPTLQKSSSSSSSSKPATTATTTARRCFPWSMILIIGCGMIVWWSSQSFLSFQEEMDDFVLSQRSTSSSRNTHTIIDSRSNTPTKEEKEYSKIRKSSSSTTLSSSSSSSSSTQPPPPPPLEYPNQFRYRLAVSSSSSSSSSSTNTTNTSSLHPISKLLLKNEKLFLYELGNGQQQGFGSMIMNMILQSVYFQYHHTNRMLVVDETYCSQYRKNITHGIMSGFFQTSFPIIQNSKLEYTQIKKELTTELLMPSSSSSSQHDSNQEIQQQQQQQQQEEEEIDMMNRIAWKWMNTNWYTYKYANIPPWNGYWFRNKTYGNPVIKVTLQQSLISFGPVRWIAHAYYKLDDTQNIDNKVHVYALLSHYLCTSLQYNDETYHSIQTLWNQSSIPLPTTTTTRSSTSSESISVAFHIRRGDKVKYESRAYETMEYVQKLVQVIQRNNNVNNNNDRNTKNNNLVLQKIQQCYVATDDYQVIIDLQFSLHQVGITNCTIYTLTQPGYVTTRNSNDFILFLAQIELLRHTTYFIGTFNSNVGGFIALYRACPYHNSKRKEQPTIQQQQQHDNNDPFATVQLNPTEISSKLNHFFHSYGVDVDDWYLK